MNFDREKRKVLRKREVDIVRLEGTVAWGAISGALDDQLDLKAVLDAKLSAAAFAPVDHTHAAATTDDPGFLSATDKMRLDAAITGVGPGFILVGSEIRLAITTLPEG